MENPLIALKKLAGERKHHNGGDMMAKASYMLVIGDKNYSSWSLRPWLTLKHCGVLLAEDRIAWTSRTARRRSRASRPPAKCLALKTDICTICDRLAIIEYLA
jgi:glutathione S-transferase